MPYKITQTSWHKNKKQLTEIRRKVFIEEQQVPEALEWDDEDKKSTHILATDHNNKPIATARMKPDGHIGRMAVLKQYRNNGIGSDILNKLIDIAREQNIDKLYLHAQTTAIDFYLKHGFITCSAEFMDAGIAHKTMEKYLSAKLKCSRKKT
jgi:predicted GNAT family N-acyltransferase